MKVVTSQVKISAEFGGSFFVEINEVLKYPDLLEDFLLHSTHYITRYKYAMDLLSKIEKKHKEQDSILDSLFGII